MINGGCKFFDKPKNLFKDGASGTASTNESAAKYILDTNKYTQWESIGSNDLTTETLEITLPTSSVIDRLLITEMNLKDFEIKYWNGSTYVAFSNVIGINGDAYTGISTTTYDKEAAYFEFTQVTTTKIQVVARKTQVANSQKSITNLWVTKELGTFTGFPRIENNALRNEEKVKTMGGKYIVQKGFETLQLKINFKTHPYQADIELLETLFDREDPFLVYPCGGRYGSQYFRIEQKGFRISDAYQMQLVGKMPGKYEKGVYTLGVSKGITLEEHV